MVDRAHKPSALATTPGHAPQPTVETTHDNSRVTATLPTGESCEVLLYGATVISWKTGNGEERLWLSDAAKLDGSKAARGGIPICFPNFGQSPDHAPTKALPQHGFARISRWEYLGSSTSESSALKGNPAGDGGVKLDFGLSPSNLDEKTKKLWPENFGLIYSVTLTRDGLATNLLVRNEGEKAWEFQFLMHSYFRVKDISQVKVHGMQGAQYIDKVGGVSTKTDSDDAVTIASEVDRVYTPVGGSSTLISVSEGSKKLFELSRDNLEQTVVWNPWIEKTKTMADFQPQDGYKQMLCVEPGQVDGWLKLEGGDTWEGGQFLRANL